MMLGALAVIGLGGERANAAPVTLTVFSDYVCPWCYLGSARAERIQRDYDVTIEYVHFPLHPETPAEGMLLEDLFGGGAEAKARLANSHARLSALAAAEGLPMVPRERTYNSRIAQELGAWAAEQGKGEEFNDAAYRAYFAEAKDVSNTDVLMALAVKVGLDGAAARKVIETRSHRERVDRDWARSRELGVTGVPTYMCAGNVMVGAQPYEELARLVEQAGATKRVGK